MNRSVFSGLSVIFILLLIPGTLFPQPYTEAVEKWSIPEKVLEGAWFPHITRDGQRLYFLGNGYYYIDKTDSGWTERTRLSDNINGLPFQKQLFISPDKKTLYITATQDWLIFRSYWDENLQDWGIPHLLTDNGINGGNGGWIVSSFLDDTTMILNYMDESFITYYDSTTNLWSAPRSYPVECCRMFSHYGFWLTPDKKKFYVSNESWEQNRGKDILVSFLMDTTYSYYYSLNFCIYMDSLYDLGLIKGNNEWIPTFTDDGRTMYFMANYDSSTRHDIYVTRMIVDENGDTILSLNEKEIQVIKDEFLHLYPVYPNPFNSNAIVRYYIKNSADVTIKLFNILGSEIRTISEWQAEGIHEQTIDFSGLPSGVYILIISSGQTKKSQKITFLK